MSLERVFEASRTLRQLRSEPLGELLEDFCDWLLEQGFSRRAENVHVSLMERVDEFVGLPNTLCLTAIACERLAPTGAIVSRTTLDVTIDRVQFEMDEPWSACHRLDDASRPRTRGSAVRRQWQIDLTRA